MGASEHPTASHGIDIQHLGVERFDQRLDLCVVQLSHIELSAIGSGNPPEENVRRRLHQRLSHHDALPVMAVRAFPGVRLKHRVHRLLKLEKQRMVSLRHHQGNQASPTDAANPHYLNGYIYDPVPIEQYPPVVGERFSVGVEKLVESCLGLGGMG